MTTMRIEYADGRKEVVWTLEEAHERVEQEYPEAEYGEWEPMDLYGDQMRCLVWANEVEAEDDNGQNAVAKIVLVDFEGGN